MIRIITARDPAGNPAAWADYPQVRPEEVSLLLGLQFDRDLVEILGLGVDLGVTRWAEAQWKIKTFAAESYSKLKSLRGDLDVADEQSALEIIIEMPMWVEWTETHPLYPLTRAVSIWSAVNAGGGHMSLLDVLALSPTDVEDYAEAEFIDDEVAAGKG